MRYVAEKLMCYRITGRSAPSFRALHALPICNRLLLAGEWRGAMIVLDWLFFTGLPCAISDMLLLVPFDCKRPAIEALGTILASPTAVQLQNEVHYLFTSFPHRFVFLTTVFENTAY
jgi:hypothetical protein